jgi:hypothetical protein
VQAGTSPKSYEFARQLRKVPTPAY